jgi:hypothetical protein
MASVEAATPVLCRKWRRLMGMVDVSSGVTHR